MLPRMYDIGDSPKQGRASERVGVAGGGSEVRDTPLSGHIAGAMQGRTGASTLTLRVDLEGRGWRQRSFSTSRQRKNVCGRCLDTLT